MALTVAAIDVAGDTAAAGSAIVPAPVAIAVTAATGLPGTPGAPGAPGTPGAPGADGRAVEVAVVAGAIAWRYVGDVAWTNLVALTALVGPAGADGSAGAPGDVLAMGAVTTGAAGTVAAATITGVSPNKTLNLTIPRGDAGASGTPGTGVPAGGAAGQVLAKSSAADYATGWITPAAGGTSLPPVGKESDVLTVVGGAWASASVFPGARYAATVLADSPQAFWPDAFGRDKSGNGRHLGLVVPTLAMITSPLTRSLIQASAVYGTSTAGRFGNVGTATWALPTVITLEAILHYRPTGNTVCPVSCDNASLRAWRIHVDPTGHPEVFYWYSGATYSQLVAPAALTPGPHHLAFTYDGAAGRIYVDGVQVASDAHVGALKTSGNGLVTVGYSDAGGDGTSTAAYLCGLPFEGVAVHGAALSAARILAHATAAGVV